MATRKKPIIPPDDGQAVALVPIDARGRLVEGAGSWPMPIEGDPGTLHDDEHELPPEQSSADRVMALLSEISADERAVVKVFRKLPNGKQAWCNDYSPSEFEQGGMTMIRRSWGAGDFVIVLYGGTPYRIKSRSEVHIDASREPEPQAQQGTSELSQMLRQMAEGQALMLRAITERPDPMASMTQTLAMMSAMREAMGINNAPAQKSTVGELVDAIKELRGASDLITGKPEADDDSLLGIAKTFLPAIVQAAGAQRAQAPAQPFPAVSLPPSIAHVDTDAPQPMPQGEDDMLGMTPEAVAAFKLKAFVASLVMLAKGGDATVEKAAELVYEKIPDEALEILELPVWFDLFKSNFPEVEPIEAWLTTVRDRVLAFLAEDAREDAQGDAPGGEQQAAP